MQGESILVTILVGVIIAGVGGGIAAYFKKKLNERDVVKDKVEELIIEVNKINRSLWRLSKTIIVITKLLDEQTEKAHPELTTVLEEVAEELLDNDQK